MTDQPGPPEALWEHDPAEELPDRWVTPVWPGWHAWLAVDHDRYYARRPRSSPPKIVGPCDSLSLLAAEIGRAEGCAWPWANGSKPLPVGTTR
jgi:hypothetical protein